MLEINCTYWINECCLTDFSDSIANSGIDYIAKITWDNACEAILNGYRSNDPSRQIIRSTKDRVEIIDYFKEFGAWTKSELSKMSNIELSALALQYIAGNYIDDMHNDDDFDDPDYQSGYFYRGSNENIYACLSN